MKSYTRSGYTLIELVLAIAIVAIITTGLASYILTSMNAWVFVKTRETALSNCRTSIERIVRELRRIKKPNSILVATTGECEFLDIDSADIHFLQSGTDLLCNSVVLATGVASPEGIKFTYYDSGLNVTSVKQNMRYIKVSLNLFRGTQSATLEDGARIRNL